MHIIVMQNILLFLSQISGEVRNCPGTMVNKTDTFSAGVCSLLYFPKTLALPHTLNPKACRTFCYLRLLFSSPSSFPSSSFLWHSGNCKFFSSLQLWIYLNPRKCSAKKRRLSIYQNSPFLSICIYKQEKNNILSSFFSFFFLLF